MGKKKFFKCPKCSTLLTLEIQLPENVESWPFVTKYKHISSANAECEILLAIDRDYNIREIGKEGMDERGTVTAAQSTEDKKTEDLDFKIVEDS